MSEEKVNHPKHYNAYPSGVECITVVEHMPFNLGNAIKYLWRAGEKGAFEEDLRKAIWYIEREIQRKNKSPASTQIENVSKNEEIIDMTEMPKFHEWLYEYGDEGMRIKCMYCGVPRTPDVVGYICPKRPRE